MYVEHYSLKTKPFEITADPEFLWLGEKHREAYAMLRYGVLENKGILLLTGDVGAGKTTLIKALVGDLSGDVICATVPDPGVGVMDFYRFMARGFGIDASFSSKGQFITVFGTFLHECFNRRKIVLLIIDEAQRMSERLLDDVRMLSNLEHNGVKMLNIFFVGQQEFLVAIGTQKFRAFRQRITLSYAIEPLDLEETYRYIASRLKRAGAKTNCFTKGAIKEIHEYSGGSPRVINLLCDMAMMVGFSKGVTRLEKQTVRDAAEKLPGVTAPVKKKRKLRRDEPREPAV
ncbi:ExeA family protein [Desulfoluna butyratoxydans]|uniref:Aaa+ atpase domain n=1 Tax=Desulfoluna butyratoxydans TaxID=231438 RepID=A0A4U8YMQ9_9BACT|nr:AAA family ATPase [Desulfoluna butyratoxydans]VFQ44449.1 aaa+ atpase domain [Desulfoluna butyratoxydans]